MVPTSNLDSVLEELALLEKDSRLISPMKDQIQALKLELGFLNLFIWSLPKKSVRKYFIRSTLGKGEQALYSTGDRALGRGKFRDWDLLASKLLQKIEDCKPKIKENCLRLSDDSYQDDFSSSVAILLNLKHLVSLKADITVALERIIGGLEDKLILFTDVLNFSPEGCIFKVHIQAWAHKLACLSLLYWADQTEETMAARMGIVRSDLLQMVNLCTPKVIGMYLEVSKVLKSSQSNTLVIVEAVAMFVNFLLNNLVVSMNEHFEVLQERLIFLITFLMNPPEERHSKEQKLVLAKANAIANKVLPIVCSLSVGRMKKDIAKGTNFLHDFLENTETVESTVKELYVPFLHSSSSNFPRTKIVGFIDLVLQNMENLKEILKYEANFLGFTRHQFVTIHKKLGSLRSFAEYVLGLKEKHEELEGLWLRIINVANQAELVIDSYQIMDVPIWYSMIRLSYVREEINSIEAEIKEIRDKQMYSIGVLEDKLNSRSLHVTQGNGSRMDEVLVGFEDEKQSVINQLTRGSTQLEIVSIVGMPGQGKTTLAEKVYCDPAVQYHFHKCAWSYVSQVYKRRDLLLQILRDVNVRNAQIYEMSEDDLAECAYKNLKGRRFLIVMDDIWDISAWDALKESFPNDNNGSRILFTSRNGNLSLLAKSTCSPLHLRPLSVEESWKLIQEKLFDKNGCPLKFSEIGKLIAKSCKGLPLAIVAIAGVLAREIDNLNWWKKNLPCLDSWLFSEGCMDILELSYKNLPDFLKPCFLYLGAFGNAQEIKVQKLTQLWISEGFIPKVGLKSLEDVAMEYLMDLVGTNLVIIAKRHSSGKIKQCRVHDLLRELCLSKVKEERFFNLLNNPDHSLNIKRYEHYRLCISSKWRPMDSSNPISPNIRSVIFSGSWVDKLSNMNLSDTGLGWIAQIRAFSFVKFKFLKVLDLDDTGLGWIYEGIFSLILLKYLSVRCDMDFIPPSIANLQSLEFFRLVNGKPRICIPNTIWKMKRLRHIDVVGGAIISLDDYEFTDSTELPRLVSISLLCFYNGKDAEKTLRSFPRIRKLKLQFIGSRIFDWFPDLNCLSKLESLKVKYVSPLHRCAFNLPSTLNELTLSGLFRPWSEISAIGKLTKLEVLKLLSNAFVGEIWDMEDDQFLNLKFLKLCSLNIAQWNVSFDSLTCLERLVVEDCTELEEIPSRFAEICTLKKIEISGCSNRVENSAREIHRELQEMGNEGFDVLISGVRSDDWFRDVFKRFHIKIEDETEDILRLAFPMESSPRTRYASSSNFRYFEDPTLVDHEQELQTEETAFKQVDHEQEVQSEETAFKQVEVQFDQFVKPAAFKQTVGFMRRTKVMHKYNMQPRQAITGRHCKEELKRESHPISKL